MKPFYGIDRTTLKKNTFHEGDCFIAATVSDMTRQSYVRALQSAAKELEATKLNPVLRGLKTVCSWITLIVFLSTIRALRNVTIAEAFENAPFIFRKKSKIIQTFAIFSRCDFFRKKVK